jgi:hypothetical protein
VNIADLLEKSGGIQLDIACGGNKQSNFVGIDIQPLPGVDIVHDLANTPWPLPDECVFLAMASHYVEHIPKVAYWRDESGGWHSHLPLLAFMDEVWRVMKPGGRFMIAVPHGHSSGFLQDPTHAALEDKRETSTGSKTANFTLGSSQGWIAGIAAFKESSDSSITASVTDAATVGEAVSITMGARVISKTDAVTVAEAVSVSVTGGTPPAQTISVTDGASVGEAISAALGSLVVSKTEAITVGEAVAAQIGSLAASKVDAVTVGEAVTISVLASGILSISVTDGVTTGETVAARIPTLSISAAQAVTVGESATVSITSPGAFAVSVADAITTGENVTAQISTLRIGVTDGATVGESAAAAAQTAGTISISVTDSATVGESTQLTAALFGVSISDVVTVGESVSISMVGPFTGIKEVHLNRRVFTLKLQERWPE